MSHPTLSDILQAFEQTAFTREFRDGDAVYHARFDDPARLKSAVDNTISSFSDGLGALGRAMALLAATADGLDKDMVGDVFGLMGELGAAIRELDSLVYVLERTETDSTTDTPASR